MNNTELNLTEKFPKIFVSSDHHFYHRNIIKYANRPFDYDDENCVIDNAKLMIARHNEVISNNDYSILVGDLSASLRDRREHFSELLKLLNGKKILVRGNHDYENDDFYINSGFIAVLETIEIGEYFFSHYPCYESRWTTPKEKEHIKLLKQTKCKKIIHGHIHNKDSNLWVTDGCERTNVCVDYTPDNFYSI